MPDPPSSSRIAGRHTLGSSPEFLEPRGSAPAPSLPPLPLQDPRPGPSEPQHSIYVGEGWENARRRLDSLPAARRAAFGPLLDSVESAWPDVRELQLWYEENPEHSHRGDDYADLLSFIDADLVDIFRDIAAGIADLVPGAHEPDTDPDEVEGDLESFRRYFNLFRLAARAAAVPEPFTDVLGGMEGRLAAWTNAFAEKLSALREVVE